MKLKGLPVWIVSGCTAWEIQIGLIGVRLIKPAYWRTKGVDHPRFCNWPWLRIERYES